MYKPSLSQTIQNTYFRFPDDGSQKQKVPKKTKASLLISYLLSFSTFQHLLSSASETAKGLPVTE
jgi:hypothetical protein